MGGKVSSVSNLRFGAGGDLSKHFNSIGGSYIMADAKKEQEREELHRAI